jgi:hypothetical protein
MHSESENHWKMANSGRFATAVDRKKKKRAFRKFTFQLL